MQDNTRVRIVIDTNIWISFLFSSRMYQRVAAILASDVVLLFSQSLIDEIDKTVHKAKFQKHTDKITYYTIFRAIQQFAEFVEVPSVVEICRDPKDNFLLALAKDGNADYLITGDDDLLTLKQYGKTKIVTITEFENTI